MSLAEVAPLLRRRAPRVPSRAISVGPVWMWAIGHASKRCENRVRDFTGGYRGPLLLHAALGTRKKYFEAADWLRARALAGSAEVAGGKIPGRPTLPPLAELARGGYVGTAELVDVVCTDALGHRRPRTDRSAPCLLCGTESGEARCRHADPWALPDNFGLLLADVALFDVLVPGPGALGLMRVDPARFERAQALAREQRAAGQDPAEHRAAFDALWRKR